MAKLKTKSSCKKRFKVTASGKVKHKPAGKKHGMIKRSNKFIRSSRKMAVLPKAEGELIKKFLIR